jgi:transposase
MMLSFASQTRIFVFSGVTDMRKSFHGLSGLVSMHFDVDLLSGHLFLFFNRRRDCVKILAWDRDGLAIWYKRLEAGTFQMPASEDSSIEIDYTQLSLLLSGVDLASARRRKRFKLP